MTFADRHVFNCFGLYIKPRTFFPIVGESGSLNPFLVILVFFVTDLLRILFVRESGSVLSNILFSLSFALFEYFLFYRLMNLAAVFLGGGTNHTQLRRYAYAAQLPIAVLGIPAVALASISAPVGILLIVLFGFVMALWGWLLFYYSLSRLYSFSAGRAVFLVAFIQFWLVFLACLLLVLAISVSYLF